LPKQSWVADAKRYDSREDCMVDLETKIEKGGCFCGAVEYQVTGRLRDVVNCHCIECTQLNGNFGSHSKALTDSIQILKDDGLTWYQISDTARRGFCRKCGSSLFWEAKGQNATGIVIGSLEKRNQFNPIGHIFVGEKSDFYEITDNLPQFQRSSNGKLAGDYL